MLKTKLSKEKGWYRLMVDDAAVNKAYQCKPEKPIVLAVMSNFFDSGCWSVEDFRIAEHNLPNYYFFSSQLSTRVINSEEERQKLISRLHTYREEEKDGIKSIVWDSFDKALFIGDNPSCKDKHGYEYNMIARFTDKAALEEMAIIKEYWNNFEGTDLSQGKIENPYRQISDDKLRFEELMENYDKTKKPKMK